MARARVAIRMPGRSAGFGGGWTEVSVRRARPRRACWRWCDHDPGPRSCAPGRPPAARSPQVRSGLAQLVRNLGRSFERRRCTTGAGSRDCPVRQPPTLGCSGSSGGTAGLKPSRDRCRRCKRRASREEIVDGAAPFAVFLAPIAPMQPPRCALVWLLVLPQLLFLGLGGRLVLCLAPDGHVQLESSASFCCDVAESEQPSQGMGSERVTDPTEEGQASDCGPCTDLEIIFVCEAAPDSSSGGTFVPPLAAPSPEHYSCPPRAQPCASPRPPSVSKQQVQLRVTVIRC